MSTILLMSQETRLACYVGLALVLVMLAWARKTIRSFKRQSPQSVGATSVGFRAEGGAVFSIATAAGLWRLNRLRNSLAHTARGVFGHDHSHRASATLPDVLGLLSVGALVLLTLALSWFAADCALRFLARKRARQAVPDIAEATPAIARPVDRGPIVDPLMLLLMSVMVPVLAGALTYAVTLVHWMNRMPELMGQTDADITEKVGVAWAGARGVYGWFLWVGAGGLLLASYNLCSSWALEDGQTPRRTVVRLAWVGGLIAIASCAAGIPMLLENRLQPNFARMHWYELLCCFEKPDVPRGRGRGLEAPGPMVLLNHGKISLDLRSVAGEEIADALILSKNNFSLLHPGEKNPLLVAVYCQKDAHLDLLRSFVKQAASAGYRTLYFALRETEPEHHPWFPSRDLTLVTWLPLSIADKSESNRRILDAQKHDATCDSLATAILQASQTGTLFE
jgi:hypothetical protein